MASDHGQDEWVIEVYRARLAGGFRGFFVEAGAADGPAGSNTVRLEREHGWTGLLVEPNAASFPRCAAGRPGAAAVRAVLAAADGEAEFIEAGFLPFDTHRIGALSIEVRFDYEGVRHDHDHSAPCRALLEAHGYACVGTAGCDELYLPRVGGAAAP